MCLYPKLIINKKYTANKKNGGKPPTMTDDRVKYVPVGCQKCLECRKQKAREWQVRLLEDIKTNKNGKFITLTISNKWFTKLCGKIKNAEGYEMDNAVATLAVKYFRERYRKKYGQSLRHWLVTELGHQGTQNIHLHGIIWTDENWDTIAKIWKIGYIWKGNAIKLKNNNVTYVNYVNNKTVNYVTKYVHKTDELHKTYRAKVLTSPGIGRNYRNSHDARTNRFNDRNTNECYRTSTGHKIAIPVYWRNLLYTDEQREKLWLHRLERNERWVCGEKVSILNGDLRNYYKLLKWHRRRNTELGYGNDEKDWNQEQYEQHCRRIMHARRKQKFRLELNASPSAFSETLSLTA